MCWLTAWLAFPITLHFKQFYFSHLFFDGVSYLKHICILLCVSYYFFGDERVQTMQKNIRCRMFFMYFLVACSFYCVKFSIFKLLTRKFCVWDEQMVGWWHAKERATEKERKKKNPKLPPYRYWQTQFPHMHAHTHSYTDINKSERKLFFHPFQKPSSIYYLQR